jgi:hypothetical protein
MQARRTLSECRRDRRAGIGERTGHDTCALAPRDRDRLSDGETTGLSGRLTARPFAAIPPVAIVDWGVTP